MAANTKPRYTGAVRNESLTILPADTTDIKDLIEAGTEGSRVDHVIVTSTDTSDKDLLIYLHDGSNSRPIGRVTIPDGAGTDGTEPAVDLMAKVTELPFFDLASGNDPGLLLENGWKLQVAAQAAVTADKAIYVHAIGGDF